MIQIQADSKIIGIIHDVFQSPSTLLRNYFIEKKINYKIVFRLHVMMWLIAPCTRLIHNIGANVLSFLQEGSLSVKFLDGTFKSFVIYPIVYILILQLDKLRYMYQLRSDQKKITYNPHKALPVPFLPFSSSAVFWILPEPLNLFFIMGSIVYSILLSKEMFSQFLRFDKDRIVNLGLVLLLFLMVGAVILTFVLNIIRTLIN